MHFFSLVACCAGPVGSVDSSERENRTMENFFFRLAVRAPRCGRGNLGAVRIRDWTAFLARVRRNNFFLYLFNGLAQWLARWAQSSTIDGSKPHSIELFYTGFFIGLAQGLKWGAQASEVDGSKALSRKFFDSVFQEGIFGGCSQTNRF